jgi:hypothetical protein
MITIKRRAKPISTFGFQIAYITVFNCSNLKKSINKNPKKNTWNVNLSLITKNILPNYIRYDIDYIVKYINVLKKDKQRLEKFKYDEENSLSPPYFKFKEFIPNVLYFKRSSLDKKEKYN